MTREINEKFLDAPKVPPLQENWLFATDKSTAIWSNPPLIGCLQQISMEIGPL